MREKPDMTAAEAGRRRTTREKSRLDGVRSAGELHGTHGATAIIVPAEVSDAPSTPAGPLVARTSATASPQPAPHTASPLPARSQSASRAPSPQPARPQPASRTARLDPAERAYRAAVLRDVAARERAEGPHTARPHADRARQFMPFAALKGYREMAREQEAVREPRRDMTEERALALSKEVAKLRKGDIVRIVHYEAGAYQTLVGAVARIDEAFRRLTVVKRNIPFDDILSIERLQ